MPRDDADDGAMGGCAPEDSDEDAVVDSVETELTNTNLNHE